MKTTTITIRLSTALKADLAALAEETARQARCPVSLNAVCVRGLRELIEREHQAAERTAEMERL